MLVARTIWQIKKALHSATVLVLCVAISAVVLGCAPETPKSSTTATPEAPATVPIAKPEISHSEEPKVPYTTAAVKDISFRENKRVRLYLVVAPHSDENSVKLAVEHAVMVISRVAPINAVQVLVYDRAADIERDYTLAKADWAPNGVWADAAKVKSGDYSAHKFTYDFRKKVTNPGSDTRPSDLDFRLNDAFWASVKSNPKASETELINRVSNTNGVSSAQVKTSLELCLRWIYQ